MLNLVVVKSTAEFLTTYLGATRHHRVVDLGHIPDLLEFFADPIWNTFRFQSSSSSRVPVLLSTASHISLPLWRGASDRLLRPSMIHTTLCGAVLDEPGTTVSLTRYEAVQGATQGRLKLVWIVGWQMKIEGTEAARVAARRQLPGIAKCQIPIMFGRVLSTRFCALQRYRSAILRRASPHAGLESTCSKVQPTYPRLQILEQTAFLWCPSPRRFFSLFFFTWI